MMGYVFFGCEKEKKIVHMSFMMKYMRRKQLGERTTQRRNTKNQSKQASTNKPLQTSHDKQAMTNKP